MANRGAKNFAWACTCCSACCSCVWLITGISTLLAGIAQNNDLAGLNADDDFVLLDQECNIEFVGHTTEATKHGSANNRSSHQQEWICWDIYTYTFTIGEQGQSYVSRAEKIERSRARTQYLSNACGGTPKEATFSVGDRKQCWKPKAIPVSSAYNCGSTSCVKIFSPADELDIAKEEAAGTVTGGVALLTLTCCICCCCLCPSLFVATRPEEQSYQLQGNPSPGGTVPTTAWQIQPGVNGQAQAVQMGKAVPSGQAVPMGQSHVQAVPVQATVVAAPTTVNMQIQVPPGAMPGQMLQVRTPDGRTVQAVIPEGVMSGQSFTVCV
mmetsp:Transcript_34040/g.76935  ORF Transcript_34040/g.76935 Transcript_34040/m.76935 type:complete len:325 (-) Transcript_34040:167-1141(-)|eukprot:CAMPEP_0180577936 /NCGR_PEP_ID=MMETSP1037_2-20121125/12198_1 /TAXON_ID=632150 /ORGANISM="Azadinium spinosum, Strain 3D9" /LENGTH=324 /DNA_ID=CAMNT_0022595713 /DNA_START=52 /DNA_END=1026 /DNA_ORIENTATION=-